MGIRKLQSGKWQARYTDPEGQRRSVGTFLTKLSAEKALREVLQQMDKGTWELTRDSFRAAETGKTLTLAQVAERYRQLGTRGGNSLSPRTLGEYERYIVRDLKGFADDPISSITRQRVESWWIDCGDTRPVLRQRVYSHLKSVMRYALESGYVVSNPCQLRGAGSAISRPNKPIASKDQASQILEFAPVELKALFAIALWGGLRKGELLELRRKDLIKDESGVYLVSIQRAVIWLSEGVIQVKEPKWASRRNVALPRGLNDLITSHLNSMGSIDPEALLFPYHSDYSIHYPNHAINRVWAKIRKSTGYVGSLHSLRSFAGTNYAMTGATLREIMDRLGHNNYKTAMRYQRNSGRELELVGRLEGMQ
tara:strand:- start:2805 stop:3905 length:1101 start_codon:yes stop_codon:yes gene_type:complete